VHYVDSSLLGWPLAEEDELRMFRPMAIQADMFALHAA
jgi:hypothetical protein